MWFNQDDQQRGSIGDARLREIIKEIVLKVDPQQATQQELEQQSSALIATIEKHFKYKKQEIFDVNSTRDNPEMIKIQNQIKFFNGCHLANLELLEFEGILLEQKQQELKKEMQAYQQSKEGTREKAAALDAHNQALIDNIRQREKDLLAQQQAHLAQMINDLQNYSKNLDNQLKQLALDTIISRKQTADTVKSELKGIPQLENLSDQQMDKLTNGLVLLNETKELKLADLRQQLKEAKLDAAKNNKGGMLWQSSATSPEVRRLESEIDKVENDHNEKVEELLTSIGFKPDEIPEIMKLIETNPTIQRSLKEHSNKAIDNRELSKQIKEEKKRVEEKLEICEVQSDSLDQHAQVVFKKKAGVVQSFENREETTLEMEDEAAPAAKQVEPINIDINQVDYTNVTFENIDLDGADIESFDLDNVSFESIDLGGLDLEGLELDGLDLEGLDMDGLTFDDFDDISLDGNDIDITPTEPSQNANRQSLS